MLKECVRHELEALQEISKISSKDIKKEIGYDIFLPEWEVNLEYNFNEMRTNIEQILDISLAENKDLP